jgi:hypothetical protein
MDSATSAAEDTYRNPSPENSANLDRLLCLVGLFIAHELVHFFTGRLLGNPFEDTPPRVQDPPGQDPFRGEAGRFWEKRLFGYRVEAYWDPNDPLQAKQAGALYAFPNEDIFTRVSRRPRPIGRGIEGDDIVLFIEAINRLPTYRLSGSHLARVRCHSPGHQALAPRMTRLHC